MEIAHGIHVDLICADNDQKPIGFATPETEFVRMDYGAFKVRIITDRPSNATVHLDGQRLAAIHLKAGVSVLGTASDGKSFLFSPASPADRSDSDQSTVIPASGIAESAAKAERAPGLVVVSVHTLDESGTGAPDPADVPNDAEIIRFQLNPPRLHARAVAANLNRMIPPEGVTRHFCSLCD